MADAPMVVAPLALPGLRGVEVVGVAVETATGWPGLAIIAAYSFLVAFILPGPSEVVLASPLRIGLGPTVELGIVVLVSSLSKAAGSVVALRVGHRVARSGPVLQFLERRGLDVRDWSERQAVRLAERYGYLGLAIGLCVPFFPDTLSIYAFTVLEEDYRRFAAATFAGSVGRLLITLLVVGGTLRVV